LADESDDGGATTNESTYMMEEDPLTLTCMIVPVTMLTLTSTPGDDLMTPNSMMMPMLHQVTPDNSEEFADEGTQDNSQAENKDSEKNPMNRKKTEIESRKNIEEQQTKSIESTALDDVLLDDDIKNNKVGKIETDATHLVSIQGCCPKSY
jgi:hypothetical protein